MIRRSFFGYLAAKLPYETVKGGLPDPVEAGVSEKMTLEIQIKADQKSLIDKKKTALKKGVEVQRGAIYGLFDEEDQDLVAPISGTVTSVETRTGNYGRLFALIHMERNEELAASGTFEEAVAEAPFGKASRTFLGQLPGSPDLMRLGEKGIHTVVVSAMEKDLFSFVNQYVVKAKKEDFLGGIKAVSEMAGEARLVVAVPQGFVADVKDAGCEVVGVKNLYPNGNERLLANRLAKAPLSAGKSLAEEGFLFLSAEAVAVTGQALRTGRLSQEKLICLRTKNREIRLVSARVGTPISVVCEAAGEALAEKDHLIVGGPLTGTSVYTPDFPVAADTDTIICQGQENMPRLSDSFCINCGKCVRLCPANIPVNLLVRVLEKGLYEEAVEKFDLDACVECGLCSFICVAKMPLFQRIMLARHTLSESQNRAEKGGA